MKKLFLLLFCLTACALNDEIRPSVKSYPRSVDYINNIYDEWVGNRGLKLYPFSSTYPNSFLVNATGQLNGKLITTIGNPSIPSKSQFNCNGIDDRYLLSTTANGAITGDVTFAIIIKDSITATTTSTIFDSNTNVPRVKLMQRISSTNSHMGFSYAGVIQDLGVNFPYDTLEHTIIFQSNSGNAIVWMDGNQLVSFSISTAINWTGQSMYIGKAATGYEYFSGDIRKIRIYTEYLNATDIGILFTGDFQNHIIDQTPLYVSIVAGQSNVSAPVPSNIITNYDSIMQLGYHDPYLWNGISNANIFMDFVGNTDTYYGGSYPCRVGVITSAAYYITQRFPEYTYRFIEHAKGSTNLAIDWSPTHTQPSLYSQLRDKVISALALLKCEERNIVSVSFLWVQGEGDALQEAYANAYETNLTNFISSFKSDIDRPDLIFVISALSNRHDRLKEVYGDAVMSAQYAAQAADTTNVKIINTNDAIRFPYEGGAVHYSYIGETNIGHDYAYLIPAP